MDRSRIEKVEDDIDMRMLVLFECFEQFEDDLARDLALRICRAAYYRGYADAWSEPRPFSLFKDHGYSIPERRAHEEAHGG